MAGDEEPKKKEHRKKKSTKDGEEKKDRKKKHRTKEEEAERKERREKRREKKEKKEKEKVDGGEKKKEKGEKKKKRRGKKQDYKDEMFDLEGDGAKFVDKYDMGEELGRGAFSTVKNCVHKATGTNWAVKLIDKQNVGQDMSRLRIEIDILRKVKHENIIRLREIMEDDDFLYIITEVVTGGELFDKIVELGAYSEAEASLLVKKMVSAIAYLHEQNIVHRDLKPENLLLKSEEDISDIKLADFGLSKIVGQKVMLQTACGTPGYVAPEVLNAQGYGPEVDLWSIGVITYILLCGFPPFYNENLPLLFEQIMSADYDYPPDYWDEISATAKDFIDKLLQVDPAKRLTAKQALEHEWLKGHASDKKLNKVGDKMGNYVKNYREQSKVFSEEGPKQMGFK